MELFEFLMILISIIIGLGVAEVLSGVARLLRERDSVRTYWIHSLFQAGIFLALLQQWWESWNLRLLPEITFPQTGVLLVNPVLLFLIAHLLFPSDARGADLRTYYYRHCPLLWSFVVAGTTAGTFLKPLAFDFPVFQPDNLSGLVIIPFALVLVGSRAERVHAVLASGILAVVLLDTVLPAYLISG